MMIVRRGLRNIRKVTGVIHCKGFLLMTVGQEDRLWGSAGIISAIEKLGNAVNKLHYKEGIQY